MIVFLSGSESTGKSHLSEQLARHYSVAWVPEYARAYIEDLDRPYRIEDVEEIARHQIQEIVVNHARDLVFMDTGLVITKVWFQRRFGTVPRWFEDIMPEYAIGHYLLCEPDIPWQQDSVRENPAIRAELNLDYEKEILGLKCPLAKVYGQDQMRLTNAITAVDKWLAREAN